MGQLDNKRIIITGGSQGIGFVVAQKCASEGAEIIIAARNESDLKNALKELIKVSNKNHKYYPIDVSDLREVNKFKSWILENKLEINALVNCAGVYGPIGKTTNVDLTEFKKAIEINFLGTVYMCSIFAHLLKAEKRKKIVNYSGGGAASPFINYSAYATSKIAIVRFTENLALELFEDDFDVNCVAPGFVITRLHKQTIKAGVESVGSIFYKTTLEQIKSGGISPLIAADLTSYLLSDSSDRISGKFISAQWDPWQTIEFQNQLRIDNDIATLRRIDNKRYFKK